MKLINEWTEFIDSIECIYCFMDVNDSIYGCKWPGNTIPLITLILHTNINEISVNENNSDV